jgi:hypothetical protein
MIAHWARSSGEKHWHLRMIFNIMFLQRMMNGIGGPKSGPNRSTIRRRSGRNVKRVVAPDLPRPLRRSSVV